MLILKRLWCVLIHLDFEWKITECNEPYAGHRKALFKSKNKDQCCVPQCSNKAGNGVSLHSVVRNCSDVRQWRHILKMGKPFTQYHVICSEHFTEGDFIAPNSKKRRLKVDVLPSRNIPVRSIDKFEALSSPAKKKIRERDERYFRRGRPVLGSLNLNLSTINDENGISRITDECRLVNASTQTDPVEKKVSSVSTQTTIACTSSVSTQTAIASTSSVSTQTRIASVSSIAIQTTIEKKFATSSVSSQTTRKSFLFKNIKNEEQLTCCTGISSFDLFRGLCAAVENYKKKSNSTFTIKDQVLLTLLKLKLNSSFTFLSILFNIDRRTCSQYFAANICILKEILKNFIISPTRDSIRDNLPYSFAMFPNTIYVLDCTEIPVCSPTCIRCRTQTWSQYKKRHTIKVLIAITPCGMIVYNSPCYGGKASDNFLFTQSKLLDRCQQNDSIMVDKGFRIEEECESRGVNLIRPAFKENNEQLSYENCEHSRKVASARVHVERVMERLKNFRILQDEIQWNYLQSMDNIITVICGIVNLSAPILSDRAFEYS